MTTEDLDILLEKYYKGQCNPDDLALVNALLDSYAAKHSTLLDEDQRREVLNFLQKEIEGKTSKILEPLPPSASNYLGQIRPLFYKWSFAAAIVCLCICLYFMLHTSTEMQKEGIVSVHSAVVPGTAGASLVLPDGRKVAFDSALSSSIKNIQVSNSQLILVKNNGQKINLEKTAGLKVYSTLVTQRGQQAPAMYLADGTKVWLNAASSLRFPVVFNGNKREVQLTGEAYFEVAKDAAHPFIVDAEGSQIKVLGTHFNVMAYKDEPATYATLLEGAIQLVHGTSSTMLAPGEQGQVNREGAVKVKKVDTQLATAWLKGKLPMENMEIHAFLREVSRWYDVDIKYKTQIPSQTFSGNLNRNVPLAHILAALKANGVQSQLKERTLIISESSNKN